MKNNNGCRWCQQAVRLRLKKWQKKDVSHNNVTSDLLFYSCWASVGQSIWQSDGVGSDRLQTWIAFDFTTDLLCFFIFFTTGRAGFRIYLYPLFPSFPFLISDTWHHTTYQGRLNLSLPLSFHRHGGCAQSINATVKQLRGLRSLMGSQMISSGLFSLLTLRMPLEIPPFRPQHIFSEPSRQTKRRTTSAPRVSTRGRLMFQNNNYRIFRVISCSGV